MSTTTRQIRENGGIVHCPVCGERIPFALNDFNRTAELLRHSIFLNGDGKYRIVCPKRAEEIMGWVSKPKQRVLSP